MDRLIFIIILFSFFIPLGVGAAALYLESNSGQYYQGDTFIVAARIDIEGECVNAVEAHLKFSQDILKVIDFSTGNSILTLWLKSPEINQQSGSMSFSGGVPGGYCGILPGDPGESNLLGKLIFKVKNIGEQFSDIARVEFLDTSKVLLNDGLGTPAELTTKSAIFTILPGIPETPKKEWQEELEKDEISPEIFEIEINQDPSIFEGKYFITFSTTDKQTGIDYYEVKEEKMDWQKATSPYVLEDQEIKGIIKVKAVDKTGNERIAEYRPSIEKFPWRKIVLFILVVAVIIWLVIRKLKQKKNEERFKI